MSQATPEQIIEPLEGEAFKVKASPWDTDVEVSVYSVIGKHVITTPLSKAETFKLIKDLLDSLQELACEST